MTNRPISEMLLLGPISVPFSSSVPGVYPDPVGVVNLFSAAFSGSPLATHHSPLTPTIPAPSATAALRVVPAPIFTTISSIHVGAPTFSPQERPASEGRALHGEEKEGSLALLGMTGHGPRVTTPRVTSHAGNVLNCKLLTANCRLRFAGGGANFRSRLFLVVHTPLYAEVPRIQEHAYE